MGASPPPASRLTSAALFDLVTDESAIGYRRGTKVLVGFHRPLPFVVALAIMHWVRFSKSPAALAAACAWLARRAASFARPSLTISSKGTLPTFVSPAVAMSGFSCDAASIGELGSSSPSESS